MNLTRITPMLPVRSISQSIEFYKKLGFEVEQQNAQWGWALLAAGDFRVMLDQSINQYPNSPRQGVIYLYPENIIEYHRQARQNGLDVPELDTTFYNMTEFRLDDPDGNRLWIGQPNASQA